MKEKDITKGEELESINNELFGSFDSEAESGIGGGTTRTITDVPTFTPTGQDLNMDIEWDYPQIEG